MGSEDIAMQGMMMKRKSKAGLLGSKWVMRYFVLYQDGKLVYYHEKPEAGAAVNSKKKSEVLCNNIGECALDVVKASDLAGRVDSVANSFYITGKGRGKGAVQRTLLVTNGPKDFKQWMLAFRNMKVEMLHGVGSGVNEDKKNSPKKDEEIVPLQISFNSPSHDGKTADATQQSSVRFAADVDITKESKEDQDDAKSVTFSDYDDEIILEAVSGDDKSVTFSDRDDVISDRSVTFSDCGDEIILDTVSCEEIIVNGVSWKDELSESHDAEGNANSVKEVDETAAAMETAEVRETHKEAEEKVAATKPSAAEAKEQELKKAAEKIKVFAYGGLYDEMTEALDRDKDKVLLGIITTSVEELLDDEAYMRTESKTYHSELTPISIQYSGPDAHYNEVDYYKNHSHEIESFCERLFNVDRLNPIVYSDKIETRNRMLNLLGEAHQDEGYPEVTSDSPSSTVSQKAARFRTMRVADTGGLTAYKHALNVQGADAVPDGLSLLRIVREPLGTPYNWVLFKPSKEELIIEDGGSGGVMELANVLHRDYNDQVLFGLARVSFANDFGLSQFWCALEWKGENASGVKALKSYTESLAPMADRIGDRSFTLSNSSAMDLSPQIVVDFVKKSCNKNMTVQALEHAHEMEQKAIEEYWDKLEAKEKAKRDALNAEKLKREEDERKARLKIRASKLADAKDIRETRNKKWSKMNAPELLEDLGKRDLSGWVLLQVDLDK
mmetsp:Transcript_28314/g.48090  ORF Transcript_28314/g.48090 Transcript_28314/m.48090 type:complete len:726 (-) Transcript_28314:111-2288(-)